MGWFSLCWWALNEFDTFADVALEAGVACLEQLLLVVIGACDDVVDLLCSILAKLDRGGEELAASLLLDLLTTSDTWKVDESWLDDAGLALSGLDDFLREAGACEYLCVLIGVIIAYRKPA